ncbi:multidrug efflux SMR transporter [Porifericola rhodea]|uniref:DMT family transporter n=1 Tax=Porifericola rhodea TaxID=930972 RepID=UPI0026654239|nr:multidrug efflux SMR transporter [Porifericola rhodea]WKN30188.1 multidrug efflux SMR transporter [Porifericola rhodea]
MKSYWILLIAIVCETIATSALKASDQFSKLLPSIITVVGYGAAFYFLSLTLKHIPVGIAYAIWSGVGILLITLVGVVWFKQTPDLAAILGLSLIIIGIIVINVFSNTSAH